MKDPLLLRVWPYSSDMFESLSVTHPTEKHAFLRVDPRVNMENGCAAIHAYMAQDEHYRKGQRAAYAMRRLLEANVPFNLEVRGMIAPETIAEYQLWTMSDWIRGSVGTSEAGRHFGLKTMEEYVELQDEIYTKGPGIASECGDLLFCISAVASNAKIVLNERINDQINAALPRYAKRTSAKPLRFSEIEIMADKYPQFTMCFVRANQAMAAFLENVPKTYVDTSLGLAQTDGQKRIRMQRLILSHVMQCLTEAELLLSDAEDDCEYDECRGEVRELLTRSFLLTSIVACDALKDTDTSLQDVVIVNMNKIQERIEGGVPVTRV